jgi:hypothetical protein
MKMRRTPQCRENSRDKFVERNGMVFGFPNLIPVTDRTCSQAPGEGPFHMAEGRGWHSAAQSCAAVDASGRDRLEKSGAYLTPEFAV